MDSFIKIKSLKKKFKNGFSFEVNDLNISQSLMVQGENGSGKSTLLKIIAGIYKSDCGGIESSLNVDEIIYFSNEDTGLFHHLTGLENLKLFDFNLSSKQFLDWKNRLSVFNKALNTPYVSMSQGMRKVIKLFIFLNSNAKMILMDEPFSSLDIKTRAFITEYIISKRDIIFVIAEHEDMIFESRIMMKGGRNVK